MRWLRYFLPSTPLAISFANIAQCFRLPFKSFVQQLFGHDLIAEPRKSAQKKKISVVAEAWHGFGYPHILDLGEVLYKAGYEVEIVIPYDGDTERWNYGRGFRFNSTRMSAYSSGWVFNLMFLIYSLPKVAFSNIIIVNTQPTLVLGLILCLFRKHVIYFPAELILFRTKGGGAYSLLQHFIRYTSIRVITTGKHRSRLLAHAIGLNYIPGELLICALRETSTTISRQLSIAEKLRGLADFRDGIVVVCDAGLNYVNCFDLILEAEIPITSGVIIGMVGQLIPDWQKKVDAAHARTGNYFYFGEILWKSL